MNKKWHYTPRMKPETDTIVIGFWIDADDDIFVSLCYRDEFNDWYVAQDMPGDWCRFKQPRYWIEQPIKL
jgi:hypothetical protein